MKNQIIDHLNNILRNELVAINQYFLHSKILANQGFTKLAAKNHAESVEEMKHAGQIIDRILFLKGIPKMTEYSKLNIASDVQKMFKNDLALEIDAISDLKDAIKYAIDINDVGTKDLLEKILISEEEHLDFIETQLDLIKKIGLENYLTQQI